MISKIFTGHSFRPACRYICNKAGAKVLAAEGVRAHHYNKMADDFLTQQQLHPAKKQACFHGILSFYPGEGEKLGDERMLEIAQKYLEEIGIKNTQYAIAKHTDRAHLHLHIIANLVNNNGQVISDSHVGLRGKKAAQQLTEAYHLMPAKKKNLKLSHPEALTQNEAARYKIYEAILKTLPHCRNLSDLEKQLKEQNITTLYKYKGQTSEKQGISFQLGEDCFKGSKIDRKFSLENLEKYFAYRQQKSERAVIHRQPYRTNDPKERAESINMPDAVMEIGQAISGLIDELLKPEWDHSLDYGTQYSSVPRKRKKKRKKGQAEDSPGYSLGS
jgi:hypothetical protein